MLCGFLGDVCRICVWVFLCVFFCCLFLFCFFLFNFFWSVHLFCFVSFCLFFGLLLFLVFCRGFVWSDVAGGDRGDGAGCVFRVL